MRPAAGTTRAPSSDFPTAAEVAKGATGRVSKAAELKDMEEANKQARMEEADTFRGVHLDPNAHHWDEMEEDDDNFLDGVIEFGDGRQYKIDAPSSPPEGKEPSARSSSRFSSKTDDGTAETSSVPLATFSTILKYTGQRLKCFRSKFITTFPIFATRVLQGTLQRAFK
ncbi:hypothetical protein MPER_10808 [Moniliophthora perniciosa FA553]|nr:hypothetical protein MPER_10808 [Moniliophthora perniciosa FA553]